MASRPYQLICRADQLENGGQGVRFEWQGLSCFVIRYAGRLYAYVNACRHIPVEMDLADGHFFDLSRQFLVCSMHAAYYQPETGLCLGGPCRGARLQPVSIEERDGDVIAFLDTLP